MWSRNGAPYRKGCVVNGQMTKRQATNATTPSQYPPPAPERNPAPPSFLPLLPLQKIISTEHAQTTPPLPPPTGHTWFLFRRVVPFQEHREPHCEDETRSSSGCSQRGDEARVCRKVR